MKKQLIYLMMAVAMLSFESCSPASPSRRKIQSFRERYTVAPCDTL